MNLRCKSEKSSSNATPNLKASFQARWFYFNVFWNQQIFVTLTSVAYYLTMLQYFPYPLQFNKFYCGANLPFGQFLKINFIIKCEVFDCIIYNRVTVWKRKVWNLNNFKLISDTPKFGKSPTFAVSNFLSGILALLWRKMQGQKSRVLSNFRVHRNE